MKFLEFVKGCIINLTFLHLFLVHLFLVLVVNSCGPINNDEEILRKNQVSFLKENVQFKDNFERSIQSIYEDHELSQDFLLAVVNKNGMAYSFAFNGDNAEANNPPLDNDSPIYIASHTKSFTGVFLKMLEEEGLVDLNTSIGDYLPALALGDSIDIQGITVKQLLNHTHGIHSTQLTWKTAFLGYGGDNKELINDINTKYLYDPSHRFRYSNTGPILAAMIAENVVGRGWKEEMKSRIFLPLKMEHTSAYVSDYNTALIRPSVRVAADKQVFQSGFYKTDITMHAAGGIISTINDLSKWLQSNIIHDRRLLKTDASWREMHEPGTIQDRKYFTYERHGYSLGWDVATYQGDTILTRLGGFAGISFHASFIPGKKIGIIAFTNDSRSISLPHLAANYAYNLILRIAQSEEIFNQEKQLFQESFESNRNRRLPSAIDRLSPDQQNDQLTGHYTNELGWPDIDITKNDSVYIMKWGVLAGPIYRIPDPDHPFLGTLGAVERSFNLMGDTLLTGSLIY